MALSDVLFLQSPFMSGMAPIFSRSGMKKGCNSGKSK